MHVHFKLGRRTSHLRETLRQDGWSTEEDQLSDLLAWHPLVLDEGSARTRLDRLGLLTSGALRIEFRHARKQK
jgi:hypothetical protein